jgi:hypothetical protein
MLSVKKNKTKIKKNFSKKEKQKLQLCLHYNNKIKNYKFVTIKVKKIRKIYTITIFTFTYYFLSVY